MNYFTLLNKTKEIMKNQIEFREPQNRTSVQSKADLTPGEIAMNEQEYRNFREAREDEDDRMSDYYGEE